MTISCCTFLNELDLLELRLKTLEGVVDMHVICESTLSYSGFKKRLIFDENKSRFRQWPIKHVIVDGTQVVNDPWKREWNQISAMWREVLKLNPSVIYRSDLDEIPRPDIFQRFQKLGVDSAGVDMDFLMYYFDRLNLSMRWRFPTIRKASANCECPGRAHDGMPTIMDGGWHCAYMGGKDMLIEKANSTAHAFDPGVPKWLVDVSNGKLPDIETTVPYPIHRLPMDVINNRDLWKRKGFFSKKRTGSFKTIQEYFEYASDYWSRQASAPGAITPGDQWDQSENDVNRLVSPLSGITKTEELSVVEIGCGEGRLYEPLSRRFKSYIGVDICDVCIDRARKTLHLVDEFRLIESFEEIPPADTYVSFTVFMHLPSWVLWRLIAALRKKINHGGHLCFQLNDRNLSPEHRFDMLPDSDLWRGRWYPHELINERLSEAGFKTVVEPTVEYGSWVAEAI